MDAQTIIETLQRDVKDKTLLVRFYNLHNGTDIWIDGLNWRLYDFDMQEYLHEEYGIDIPTPVMFDVMNAYDELTQKTCFPKGIFSRQAYDSINDALIEMSDEAILAGLSLGFTLDTMADKYRGKWESFEAFVEQNYEETCEEEIRKVLKYFDWSKVAEEWEADYHHSEGFVFHAS